MTTYTYDAANRLATQNGQSLFTWDANGNMLADGSTVYAYDFVNRLISTTLSGVTTEFGYNGDAIRLWLIEASTLTTYTQDYAAPLPVVLQAKTSTGSTQYVYSLGTRPLAEYEAVEICMRRSHGLRNSIAHLPIGRLGIAMHLIFGGTWISRSGMILEAGL